MWPDRVSNPGPLALESDALCGPAIRTECQACKEQSDLDMHCLLRPICPNIQYTRSLAFVGHSSLAF